MPTKPGSWTAASGAALTGTALRLLSQNLDTQEERTITEDELWVYFAGKLTDNGNAGLSAESIRDALQGLVGDARLSVTAVKSALRLVAVATRASLPATGEAFTLYAVDDDNGKRSLLLFLNGTYVDYTAGSGTGGSIVDIDVTITDAEGYFTGTDLAAVLAEIHVELQSVQGSASGAPISASSSTGTHLQVEVEYWGASAPTVTGSAGLYSVAIPAGTRLRSMILTADTPTAASGAAAEDKSLTVTVNDNNTANARPWRAQLEITKTDTGIVYSDAKAQGGIERSQRVTGPAQVTNVITNLGNSSGFSLQFVR